MLLEEAKNQSRKPSLDSPHPGVEAAFAIRDAKKAILVPLASDLGTLCRSSYRLEAVTPLDMCPQTAEIEVAVHLRRAG